LRVRKFAKWSNLQNTNLVKVQKDTKIKSILIVTLLICAAGASLASLGAWTADMLVDLNPQNACCTPCDGKNWNIRGNVSFNAIRCSTLLNFYDILNAVN
jgi:hypothetical protein